MQLVLNAMLFCFILLLCFIFGAVGFYFGFNKKPKVEPKNEPAPLTSEQEQQIRKRQRQEENFWNYNGDKQD